MFNKAYNIANKYTQPLMVTLRFFDGSIEGGLGSFIILNQDGWCMTAAHNFGASFAFRQHQLEMKEYHEKGTIAQNPKWVTDFMILLSGHPVNFLENYVYPEHDLAIFKIDPSAVRDQTVFPKIKKAANISPGTSLCKLGFPFIEFIPSFDAVTGQFTLPSNLMPIPLFPIEGIYTRNLLQGRSGDGIDIMFIETSSPGIKGQSGGPIFDTEGNIYGVQSQNITMPLGFKGIVNVDGKMVEENQFLNVGIGVHTQTIEYLLRKHHVMFDVAE